MTIWKKYKKWICALEFLILIDDTPHPRFFFSGLSNLGCSGCREWSNRTCCVRGMRPAGTPDRRHWNAARRPRCSVWQKFCPTDRSWKSSLKSKAKQFDKVHFIKKTFTERVYADLRSRRIVGRIPAVALDRHVRWTRSTLIKFGIQNICIKFFYLIRVLDDYSKRNDGGGYLVG